MTAFGLLLVWLVAGPCAAGSSLAAQNVEGASLRDDWVDPDTGHRVIRLSRVPGESQSLYFHQNEFAAAGDKLVFENWDRGRTRDRAGSWTNRIYVYDFKRKQCELLVEQGGKVI